ncbi:MAG: hypothetical protein GXO25_01430 [Euryarchaeota archaeon]|nr:hypothetical protein [Euryarchaeota archaeon]
MEVDRGQSAVIDAALIAPILVLILLMGYVIVSSNTSVFMLEKNEVRYTQDLTYAVLKSTVRYVWYDTTSGQKIILEDKTVEHLISEDLYLREHGDVWIPSLRTGLESKIDTILYNLTTPIYRYSLHASYHNVSFYIGAKYLPANRMSYTTYIDMPTNNDKATITLYVWRVS